MKSFVRFSLRNTIVDNIFNIPWKKSIGLRVKHSVFGEIFFEKYSNRCDFFLKEIVLLAIFHKRNSVIDKVS